ncbi:MAG TPA: DUF4124 domain-containing protein [Gallionella sp.]|nr:DUF4124 domain-containing protein [Gallionella sp.]
MTKFKVIAAFIVGIAFSFPVAAKMYKWVDDKGTTHYGETIPPEYAGKDRSELNKSGREVKKTEVLTPEERRAKEEAAAKKQADDATALEQKRRDKALLSTYSNEKEIDLARSRNLQQVEARINGINSQLKMAEGNVAGLKKEADVYSSTFKKTPASLQEDLKESQARLAKLQHDLEKANAEKAALDARYDAEKVRYRELTGGK